MNGQGLSNDVMDIIQSKKESTLRKLKRYVTVEPVAMSINIPLCVLVICWQNLALEKACRVNLGFPDLVCDHMMDKAINNINCGKVSDRQQMLIYAQTTNINNLDPNIWKNDNLEFNSTNHDFEMEVCRAELESQKLGSTISGYVAPFDAVISIVLVLFAGTWSDKSGKRKPCILIPLLGETLSQLVALIAAIFMKQLPVEFNSVLGYVIPAIFGSYPLMSIGLFSYLTEVTEEQDRVFRFGILYLLYPIVSICTLPFSGILYKKLGYIKVFSLCLVINLLGVLYIIFVLEEPRPRVKDDTDSKEQIVMLPVKKSEEDAIEPVTHTTNNLCINVIKDCYSVMVRKRSGHGRKIVYLILIVGGLSQALEYEYENEYYFVRTKLNWEALEEAPYAAYGSVTNLIGTTIMVVVMSKYFKVTDSMLALISSIFTAVSKIVSIVVTTTFVFYVAKTLDMFAGVRSLVARSIIATVVDKTEIGKIYSVMGVLENLSRLIFVPIYTNVYKYTVDSYPNAYFICSLVVIIVVTILCWILYHSVNKHVKMEESSHTQQASDDHCVELW